MMMRGMQQIKWFFLKSTTHTHVHTYFWFIIPHTLLLYEHTRTHHPRYLIHHNTKQHRERERDLENIKLKKNLKARWIYGYMDIWHMKQLTNYWWFKKQGSVWCLVVHVLALVCIYPFIHHHIIIIYIIFFTYDFCCLYKHIMMVLRVWG